MFYLTVTICFTVTIWFRFINVFFPSSFIAALIMVRDPVEGHRSIPGQSVRQLCIIGMYCSLEFTSCFLNKFNYLLSLSSLKRSLYVSCISCIYNLYYIPFYRSFVCSSKAVSFSLTQYSVLFTTHIYHLS